MINKRLLHFYLLSISKRGQLEREREREDESCLNVVVRQQMLRHFYNMITLLLTLHTATTATLLCSQSTLNNTKQSPQSICNTVTTNSLPKNLMVNAGTASFHTLGFRTVKVT